LPVVAIPALPFSPLKFSGLMDRDFASDKRKILLMFASMPLYFCALENKKQIEKMDVRNKSFCMMIVLWMIFGYM